MSSPTEDVPAWLVEDVQAVILLAMDREADQVCDRLTHIGTTGGAAAMFSACVAWATAAGHLSGMRDAIDKHGADGVAMSPLGDQPIDEAAPGTFAARFFTAVTNRDIGMASALFDATIEIGTEHHQRCVIELVSMVGDFARHKAAEVKREKAAVARHQHRFDRRHRPKRPRRRR